MTGELRIGTSGWHYESWIGPFYPERCPKPKLLGIYTGTFATAEINLSFYRLPTEAAVDTWRESTPDSFVFAWKAHRVITHYRRLANTDDAVANVFGRMGRLGAKEGPILFQLPPQMKPNRERLAGFLSGLPPGKRYTFEFRQPGWYEPAILDLLSEFDCSLCISDHAHAPSPWIATASFVYVRGHGPSGRYHGSYEDATLAGWAGRIAEWQKGGRDVFCLFDNDMEAAAPADAQRLMALTRPTPSPVAGPP